MNNIKLVFQFGKHTGKTVEEVRAENPMYLKWLSKQDWFKKEHKALYKQMNPLEFKKAIDKRKAAGEERIKKSIQIITETVEKLKAENKKITIYNVLEYANGKISTATITNHWRKVFPKGSQKAACKIIGKEKTEKSIKKITDAVEKLKSENEKVTVKTVAELLKGRLGICTIKKYWCLVVPKEISIESPKINTETDSEKDKTIEFLINKIRVLEEKADLKPSVTFPDGFKVYNVEYFMKKFDMDEEIATDCFKGQFHVDLSQAKDSEELQELKNRQIGLDNLQENMRQHPMFYSKYF